MTLVAKWLADSIYKTALEQRYKFHDFGVTKCAAFACPLYILSTGRVGCIKIGDED